jgi:ATP-binding cassette subfamily B protein
VTTTSVSNPAELKPDPERMGVWQTYVRSLSMLASERWLAGALIVSGMALAIIQVVEQQLYGAVVTALSEQKSVFGIITLWGVLGFIGIIASVVIAVASDRLSHRRRLAAMGDAFGRAITMPISYHARKGSGAVVRTILAGTDALFWLWLSFLREQLTAVIGILWLVPTAIALDWRMASILGALAALYVLLNVFVVEKTSSGQAVVEQFHNNVYGRVGDVLGNVTVVQSYHRLGAEMQAMRNMMGELLEAQYPVLTWWGLLTVLTRSAATIAMVAIFLVGALLASRGEIGVGTIVTFVASRLS